MLVNNFVGIAGVVESWLHCMTLLLLSSFEFQVISHTGMRGRNGLDCGGGIIIAHLAPVLPRWSDSVCENWSALVNGHPARGRCPVRCLHQSSCWRHCKPRCSVPPVYMTARHKSCSITDVVYGVPQGSSVHGPFLSIIYTADLALIVIDHCLSLHQYADDSQICRSCPLSATSSLSTDISHAVHTILGIR